MHHVGNDIVALDRPGTRQRSGDRRFLDRVLTLAEQQTLLACDDPDTLLWMFWAAKETAYKAAGKCGREISSAPKRYRVILDQPASAIKTDVKKSCPIIRNGMVKTPAASIAVRLFIHQDHVHCIGMTGGVKNLPAIIYGKGKMDGVNGELPTPSQESRFVRELAGNRLAGILGSGPGDIEIRRNRHNRIDGPPRVFFKGKKFKADISLSHHGRYAAYAFLLDQ